MNRSGSVRICLFAMVVLMLGFVSVGTLFGQNSDEPLRVAFVYPTPVGDMGWTFSHDEGRKYLEQNFDGELETTAVEGVPAVDVKGVMGDLAVENDIIFGPDFGYQDHLVELSEQYPETVFMHAGGWKTTDNMGNYMGKSHEASYVAGIVAGHMTESNLIGYVAAHPLPETTTDINALALGARSVNPEAEIRVIYSNTWYDPAAEREAAMGVIDLGADVVAQYQNSPAVQQAAEERGIYSIGFHADMREFAPEAYLTGPAWNWGSYYVEVAEAVRDGTWESDHVWLGMETGVVELTPYSDLVPEEVQQEANQVKEAIVEGEVHPFEGPIYDQEGMLRVQEGEVLPAFSDSGESAWEMDWFVENIRGTIPD